MATTIRDLLVRLGVQADTLAARRFDAAIDSAKSTMIFATRVATVLTGAVTALTGATVAQTIATGRSAEEAIRQSEALAITVEEFTELRAVVNDFGADVPDLVDAIATIADRSEDAGAGMKSMAEDFALVGITINKEFLKLKPQERFLAFADAVSKTEDPAKRLTAAVRVLGDDAGRKLLPLMLRGADGIAKLRQEARLAGLVLDRETAEKAAEAARSFRRLTKVVAGVRQEVGVAFAPIVRVVSDRITDWILANRQLIRQNLERVAQKISGAVEEFGRRLREVDRIVREDVGGWAVVFDQVRKAALLTGVAVSLRVVLGLTHALTLAFGGLAAVGAPVVITIGLVVAAIAGLVLIGEDLLVFLRGGRSAVGDFLDSFGRSDEIRTALLRLFDAFGRLNAVLPTTRAVGAALEAMGLKLDELGPKAARVLDGIILATLFTIEGAINLTTAAIDAFIGAIETADTVRLTTFRILRDLAAEIGDAFDVASTAANGLLSTLDSPAFKRFRGFLADAARLAGRGAQVQAAIQSPVAAAGAAATGAVARRFGPGGLVTPGATIGAAAVGAAVQMGGNTFNQTFVGNPQEFEETMRRLEIERNRQAMAAARGGER